MPYEANPLLRVIRRLAPLHSVREASDGHLLERFVAAKDEAAFEGLMHRHGQMVLAVCRRVLSSPQDVEDAFQATFLVLVQKADSMRKQESIAGWLFGVAHNVAARLRQKVAKRGLCEGHPAETLAADTASVEREETAAQVPAALVKSTLQASLLGTAGKTAAVGVVPAQVFTLTKEVTKAMFLTKLQMVTVTIIAVGVVCAGAAGVTYVLGKGGDGTAV